MEEYRYLPLDREKQEIRLVVIHPGDFQDPVHLSIIHKSLDIPDVSATEHLDLEEIRRELPPGWSVYETLEERLLYHYYEQGKPSYTTWNHPNPEYETGSIRHVDPVTSNLKYEALSYVWGSCEDQVTVKVVHSVPPDMEVGTSGLDSPSLLQITRNLHNTIRHLRTAQGSRTMWIDAICINQADDSERNQEVQRMRDIYRLAFRVVMYLGPASSSSGLALSVLSYLGRQLEVSKDRYFILAPEAREKNWWDHSEHIPHDYGMRQAILDLINRPYFERLWIIQEIQFGSHRSVVQVGKVQVPWCHFRRGLVKSLSIADYTSLLNPRFNHAVAISWPFSNVWISDLFLAARKSICSDPRDKVFGLLGLLPVRMARKIRPHYSDAISKVYKEMFLTFLDCSKRFDLLELAAVSHKVNVHMLPSWTTDLSGPLYTYDRFYGLASSHSAAEVMYIPPETLESTGVDCSSVSIISEALSKDTQQIIAIVKRIWSSTDDDYISGETRNEALARTLVYDYLRSSWPEAIQLPTLEEAVHVFGRLHNGEAYEAKWRRWVLEVCAKLEGKRLFNTEEGLIGIADGTIQPADRIIVLLGCYFPVLVRRVSGYHYRIVGRCYLHGMMYGEALLGPIPKPWVACYEHICLDGRNTWSVFFHNTATKLDTNEDPRLGEMPENWKEDSTQRDDMRLPYRVRFYRNKRTGECINSDPRMLPAALRERGVPLQKFLLVWISSLYQMFHIYFLHPSYSNTMNLVAGSLIKKVYCTYLRFATGFSASNRSEN